MRGAIGTTRKKIRQQQDKKITCRNCGSEFPHTGQCPAKGKQCNYCKKPNQFKKVCCKRLECVKEIKSEGAYATPNAPSSDNDDNCYSIKSELVVGATGKKTPKSTVKINQVKYSMLIDTGASVNILDEQTYQKIGSLNLQKKNIPPLYPYGVGNH